MGRSERYPTHYRIGVLNGKDVYYNPQEGLAIERDHMYLVEMTPNELEAWHCQEELKLAIGIGLDYSERPSCVTRNVRLGMEEW